MRATILLTILGASLAFINGGAQAREDRGGMSGAEQAGYDSGWDAADQFCRDLRKPVGGFARRGSVTGDYKRGCRHGFDEYIDSNRSCQQRLEEQDKYEDMGDARRDACS